MFSSKKAFSTALLVVLMGLVILAVEIFPVGTAIARGLGLLTAEQTNQSYNVLADRIKEVGKMAPGTRPDPIILKMDEDSAIIGFSSGSQGIKIIRDWGIDFEWPRPAECGGSSCICICHKIEHETAFGREAFYCKTPQIAKPEEKYTECITDLGVDIMDEISKEKFSSGLSYVDYGTDGGFFLGRATIAEGLIKSGVFNMPEEFQVWVERGTSGPFVAVCLHQNGCIDAAADQAEGARIRATKIYDKAMHTNTRTQEGLESVRDSLENLLAVPELVEALENDDPEYKDIAYYRWAMANYNLFEKYHQGRAQDVLEALETAEDEIGTYEYLKVVREKIYLIECDYIDTEEGCGCYSVYMPKQSACEKSKHNCYISMGMTYQCEPCTKVKECGDYITAISGPGIRKGVCERNPCRLSPACRWDPEAEECISSA